MKDFISILCVIVLAGLEVDAQPGQTECYVCGYVNAKGQEVFKDYCTPANFGPNKPDVLKAPCPGTGKCYTLHTAVAGIESYARACTTMVLPNLPAGSISCGNRGVSCCNGTLCNGVDVRAEKMCYNCIFYEGMLLDNCSPAKFKPESIIVTKKSCPSGGQCFTSMSNGTAIRGCTSKQPEYNPKLSYRCDENGVKCCDGNLCNAYGPKSGSISTLTAGMTTCLYGSLLAIVLFTIN